MPDTRRPRNRPAFATRVIHAGQSPDPSTGAIMPPIYATSTYVQESPGVHKGYEYSRSQNPTRMAYERCIADLESGQRGYAFASGLSAIATLLDCLDSGSHVIAMDDLYGGSYRLFERVRRRSAGLDFTFVDTTSPASVEAAIPVHSPAEYAPEHSSTSEPPFHPKVESVQSRSSSPNPRSSTSPKPAEKLAAVCIQSVPHGSMRLTGSFST